MNDQTEFKNLTEKETNQSVLNSQTILLTISASMIIILSGSLLWLLLVATDLALGIGLERLGRRFALLRKLNVHPQFTTRSLFFRSARASYYLVGVLLFHQSRPFPQHTMLTAFLLLGFGAVLARLASSMSSDKSSLSEISLVVLTVSTLTIPLSLNLGTWVSSEHAKLAEASYNTLHYNTLVPIVQLGFSGVFQILDGSPIATWMVVLPHALFTGQDLFLGYFVGIYLIISILATIQLLKVWENNIPLTFKEKSSPESKHIHIARIFFILFALSTPQLWIFTFSNQITPLLFVLNPPLIVSGMKILMLQGQSSELNEGIFWVSLLSGLFVVGILAIVPLVPPLIFYLWVRFEQKNHLTVFFKQQKVFLVQLAIFGLVLVIFTLGSSVLSLYTPLIFLLGCGVIVGGIMVSEKLADHSLSPKDNFRHPLQLSKVQLLVLIVLSLKQLWFDNQHFLVPSKDIIARGSSPLTSQVSSLPINVYGPSIIAFLGFFSVIGVMFVLKNFSRGAILFLFSWSATALTAVILSPSSLGLAVVTYFFLCLLGAIGVTYVVTHFETRVLLLADKKEWLMVVLPLMLFLVGLYIVQPLQNNQLGFSMVPKVIVLLALITTGIMVSRRNLYGVLLLSSIAFISFLSIDNLWDTGSVFLVVILLVMVVVFLWSDGRQLTNQQLTLCVFFVVCFLPIAAESRITAQEQFPSFELAVDYINRNSGDYNQSTWVFGHPNAHALFHYYSGYSPANPNNFGSYPLSSNTGTAIFNYVEQHPNVSFFLVFTGSSPLFPDQQLMSKYPLALEWLEINWNNVSEEVWGHSGGVLSLYAKP